LSGVNKLNAEARLALRSPEVRKTLSKQGYEPIGGTPAELESDLEVEAAKWNRVVRAANVRPE
jgi:tripartite-type tricarboxylate transporter receptor subunit TctC